MKVINKNSETVNAIPDASDIGYGEIAINYNAENPKILIKDNNNNIVGFLSEKQINSKINGVNGTISGLSTNIDNNKSSIESLKTWVMEAITNEEIATTFA